MSIEEIINELENAKQFAFVGHKEAIAAAINLLKPHPEAQPNESLTLEELRGMDGKPVWVDCYLEKGWGLIAIMPEGMVVVQTQNAPYWVYTYGKYNEQLGAELYRRPPKEVAV